MVVLFLALDAGRSWYARAGSATPTQLSSPDPSYAQPIAWPPGSDLKPTASAGERVYAQHCAICHGPQGRGNGPAAPSLHPRPRDFSRGVFKLKSTPAAQPPALADVRGAIQNGMPGTSMPAWGDILSADETDAVSEYVRTLGPYTTWAPPGAPPVLPAPDAERGRAVFVKLGCPSCHGDAARGDGSAAQDLKDSWKQPDPPRDLTAPWTFRGGSSEAALYTRIVRGMPGTPMPSYADMADRQEIAALVAYIRSIARRPVWDGGTFDTFAQSASPVERGRYLVQAGMCGLCHTPVDAYGIYRADTHYLAGGMKVEAGAHGIYFTRNLTPDLETGLGRWSVPQIADAIRTGHAPDRQLNFWGMPWMALGGLTAEDTSEIARYLKTLAPVRNRVPPPLHYGFVETVARKLTYSWPALVPRRLAYYAGNFADEGDGPSRDLPQTVLIWAQLGLLAIGAAVLVLLRRREPRQARGLGLSIIRTMLLVGGGIAAIVVYR